MASFAGRLYADFMHRCTDNPTSQRADIRKINLERAHLPGPLQIANLRIFNSSAKKRKYKASSLRTSSAFRKDA